MNKKRGTSLLAAALFIVLLLVLHTVSGKFALQTSDGEKHITVEVTHSDGSSQSFTYHTDAEYLGEVLTEEGLISGTESAYGLFVDTVDGETAANGDWWYLLYNGEEAPSGVDTLPVQDGDAFAWEYTVG